MLSLSLSLSLSPTHLYMNEYSYLRSRPCFLSHTLTLTPLYHILSRYLLSYSTLHLFSTGRCHVNGMSVALSVPVPINQHAHAQELASGSALASASASASASSTSPAPPTQEHAKEESVIFRSPTFSSDFDQPSSRSIHLLPSQRVKKVGITSGNIIDCLSITIAKQDGVSGKEIEVRLSVFDKRTDSLTD
jgi:hypothetical protein